MRIAAGAALRYARLVRQGHRRAQTWNTQRYCGDW